MIKGVVFKLLLITFFLTGACACPQDVFAGDEAAIILFFKGRVEIKASDTDKWIKAYKGMTLSTGDALRTGYRSWAEIVFGDTLKNVIKIDENTEITLAQIFPVRRLGLAKGNILSLIEKLDKGSTFEVCTPTAVCGVRGSGLGTKTDGKRTTISAYESDAFARGISADGTIMDEEIVVKEGFKTEVRKFKGPSKLKKLAMREKKHWRAWRTDLDERLTGEVSVRKIDRVRDFDSRSKKIEKAVNIRRRALEKQDTDKIERGIQRKTGDSSLSSDGGNRRRRIKD